jgi:hypothetical protein
MVFIWNSSFLWRPLKDQKQGQSGAYFALIDKIQYEAQLTHEFQAEWFP